MSVELSQAVQMESVDGHMCCHLPTPYCSVSTPRRRYLTLYSIIHYVALLHIVIHLYKAKTPHSKNILHMIIHLK